MHFLDPHGIRMTRFTAGSLQALSVVLLLGSPWWYGGADWQVQQWIFCAGLVLALLMAFHVAVASASREWSWSPGGLAWMLFILGCLAILQCQPRYPWQDSGGYSPPSVQMQRWALGLIPAPSSIAEDLIQTSPVGGTGSPESSACSLQAVASEDRLLAMSVEPMTTRAAAGNLFLAALLVCIGSAVFCSRRAYPILLVALTLLGVLIGLFGIVNVLVPSTRTWLALERSNSFATFVSKNSAGAFLNVALAAALGLVMWSVQRAWKHSMDRHGQGGRPWEGLATKPWQQFLARLDEIQIASFLALILIGTALLQTLSRGAIVSGLVAALVALVLTFRGGRSPLAVAASLIIAALTVGFMIFFQLDERVLTRLESLGELDIESDSTAGRLYIWNVSWQAAQFYAWLGSGLGTFHFASLPFQRPTFSAWYYHAESIYCETLVTMGYVGCSIVFMALAWIYRSLRSIYVSERFRDFAPIQAAGFFVLVSQSIHAAVDFALILPGVYIPAALLMGAALGSRFESHRVIRKLKGRSGGERPSRTSHTEPSDRSGWSVARSIAMLTFCMFALYYGREAAIPLAVAESVDREFTRLDRLPLEEKGQSRLNQLVERVAENRAVLDDSPQILQLIGDSLCYDDRMRRWKSRPANSDPKFVWNETAPFLIRLAYDRTDESNRDTWLRSIGGEARLETLRKASGFYAKARARSPLDWRPLWGSIYTSLDCPVSDSIVFVPVLQRTSGHLPQLLTSASIFFNDQLSEDARLRLWKAAMQTSPDAAMGIGRIMVTQYADGNVPIDIFPTNVYYFYKLAREVFVQSTFPKTHQALCDRAIEAISNLPKIEVYRAAMLTADVANEAGDSMLEIESLKKYLQWKVDDESTWVRLATLEIQNKRWDEAADTLRKLRQVNSTHPSIPGLSERILRRSQDR